MCVCVCVCVCVYLYLFVFVCVCVYFVRLSKRFYMYNIVFLISLSCFFFLTSSLSSFPFFLRPTFSFLGNLDINK